jgi:hypothetical protein
MCNSHRDEPDYLLSPGGGVGVEESLDRSPSFGGGLVRQSSQGGSSIEGD